MHLYDFKLQTASAYSQAIIGNFSDTKQQEIVACRGGTALEVLQVDPNSGKLYSMLIHECFGVIRAIQPVRLTGGTKDFIAVASDSGRIVILEYDAGKNALNKVHQETFGRSGCRRIVPGQYLAADPQGRAVMIAAIEKQKFVYVLNRDSEARLTISSPLEAHKSHNLTFALVGLDTGFENPVFAAIECDYQDADEDTVGGVGDTIDRNVVFYELDLGLNHVIRKWSEAVPKSSNLLIPVPGGANGPGGVLVCSENEIVWKNQGDKSVKIPIPRRSTAFDDPKRGVLIVSYTVHRMKNMFFILAQSEHGDIYKITMDVSADADKEMKIKIKYFDTVPVAASLCIFKLGFLFVASEFNNHCLYQIEGLGDDEDDQEYSDADMQLEEGNHVYFKPRPLKNLSLVDELQSLAPLIDAKVLNITGDDSPQIYALCGKGANSSLKVLRNGLEVSELVKYPLPGDPVAVWSIKSQRSDEYDSFIIISFINATLVLSIGETVEEVTDSGFLSSVQTLNVQQVGEDSLLQIHAEGLRHIHSDKPVSEWQPPEGTNIVHSGCNNRQVAIALSNNELVYFEMDNLGQLNEYHERRQMSSAIQCLNVGEIPEGRQRSRFLAVGCDDQTARILSLDPNSCLEPLSMLALDAPPSSLLMIDMMDFSSDKIHTTSYLNIGLQNGVLVRSVLDTSDGSLSDARSRYLGMRPVKLFNTPLQGETAMMALSSRPWLNYSYQRRFHMTPLMYEMLEFASPFNSEQCPEAIVSIAGNTLRIMTFDKLGVEWNIVSHPLWYTPRKFIFEPHFRNFIILETEHGALPYGTKLTDDDDVLPEQFGLIKAGKSQWASCIRVMNPMSGETIQRMDMDNNEAVFCITQAVFHADPLNTYYVIGAARDMTIGKSSCSAGYLLVYRLIEGGQLQFIHRTELESAPTAVGSFQGRLLVGMGRIVRIYDLGKKKLLRKCENKGFPQCVTSFHTQGDRIIITDIQESIHFARYIFQENKIVIFADDSRPRWMTCSVMLDYNTAMGADKFGNVFVVRLGKELIEEMDDDISGNRLLYERNYLYGAPYKLDSICEFYVGEIITSLQKAVLVAGGRDVILYTTLSGSIGILSPVVTRDNIELLQTIEMHMRTEAPPLAGREHLAYRSYYVPCKNVIDGTLVEQFSMLDPEKKRSIADELDRSASDIGRQIESMRTRVS